MTKGFTLIELMVVVVITSVLAGISMPVFRRSYDRMARESSVDRLAALMIYARERAVMEGKPVRLNVEPEAGTFWLSSPGASSEIFERIQDRFGRVQRTPRGSVLRFESEFPYVLFSPDGTCGAASIEVKGDDDVFRLKTVPALGRAWKEEAHEDK